MNLFLIKEKLRNDFPLISEAVLPHPQWAAVMVMLYPKPKKTHVLMTKRAMCLKYHAGEMGFPGGLFEESDGDLLTTAIRETKEELAIQVEHKDVLGELPVVTTRLGFEITPFVAVLSSAPDFEANESEVAKVLDIPFSSLLSTQQEDVGGKPDAENFIYWFHHYRIWGASARILNKIGHLGVF